MISNKFVIVVPVFNARKLIIQCIESILAQDFNDLGIIIRDDISTDGTDDVLKQYLGVTEDVSIVEKEGKTIMLICNRKKLYPVGNTYESVIKFVDNKSAIVGVVDGDDRLIDNRAVSKIYDAYKDESIWMVWSQHTCTDGSQGQSKPMPPDEYIYSGRNYWSVSHFRTSRAALYYKLRKADLMDPFVEGEYYTFAGDAAFLYPFCEMCGVEHSKFLDENLYEYNNLLPSNEHHKSFESAVSYGSYIKAKGKKYSQLDSLTLE